jgi:hypothetical protein
MSGGIAPRILNLVTRWWWVVIFTLRPLYPREKSSRHPLVRWLYGPQGQSGHGGEKNFDSLVTFLNSNKLIRRLFIDAISSIGFMYYRMRRDVKIIRMDSKGIPWSVSSFYPGMGDIDKTIEHQSLQTIETLHRFLPKSIPVLYYLLFEFKHFSLLHSIRWLYCY